MNRLKKRITELEGQTTIAEFRPRVIELRSPLRENGKRFLQVGGRLHIGGKNETVTNGEKVPIDD